MLAALRPVDRIRARVNDENDVIFLSEVIGLEYTTPEPVILREPEVEVPALAPEPALPRSRPRASDTPGPHRGVRYVTRRANNS